MDQGDVAQSRLQKEKEISRFETELEFLSCLANPFYLHSLAQQSLFSDPAFLNYLTYLLYFTHPTYSRYIQYPQCLHHLHLLVESESFREACKNEGFVQELAGKQLAHWAGWREEKEKRKGVEVGEAKAENLVGEGEME